MASNDEILQTMIEIVEEAGAIIASKRNHLAAWQKESDLVKGVVTAADVAADDFIIERLSRAFPEFSVVSEEVRPDGVVHENCFVIDPIDGTINFMNGLPLWGTQMVCVRDGRSVASVIKLHDLGRLYAASEEGAWLNGAAIHVSDVALSQGGLYAIESFDRLIGRREMIERECLGLREQFATCASFAFTAAGNFAAAVYLEDLPWDWMPGELLVRSAGGVSFSDDDAAIHIVANTPENLEVLKNVFCEIRNRSASG